jgi:ribose transport system permease protein
VSTIEVPEESTSTPKVPTEAEQSAVDPLPATGVADWRRHLSFRNIGAVYVWGAIIIVFSAWAPETFPTMQTVQSVLNQNAISGLVALALVVPLSARVFDLSVGSAMGLCNVIAAWLLVNQGFSISATILLTIGAGAVIGLVNAVVVVGWKIDSFIATLATGSLMAAAISLLSEDQAIIGEQLLGDFSKLATTTVLGLQVPVYLMLVVALAVWLLLNFTSTGRKIYSTGFNEEASRLTGINTKRLRAQTLIVSGVVAAIAGLLLTSQVSSGSPDIGPPYLLDAFAAAFLGATQFGGRFNAWGTVIAVLLLGTGKTGLLLVGAPVWAPSMFAGVVLLLALGATGLERRSRPRSGGGRRTAVESQP